TETSKTAAPKPGRSTRSARRPPSFLNETSRPRRIAADLVFAFAVATREWLPGTPAAQEMYQAPPPSVRFYIDPSRVLTDDTGYVTIAVRTYRRPCTSPLTSRATRR